MEYKKRLQYVLLVGLVTAVGVCALKYLHLFEITPSGTTAGVERLIGFALNYSASFLVYVIAAIPGMFIMKRAKVPHFVALSLFAIALAFWLSYLLTPLATITLGWTVWLLSSVLLLFITYILADLFFNGWKASFKRKVITATLLTIVIAFVCDRLLMVAVI